MSVWQGFKSIFIGEDEIEEEEYAAYRPQQASKPEPTPAPQPVFEAQKEQPAPVAEEPVRRQTPPPQRRQSAASESRSSTAYNTRSRNAERESEVRMSTTEQSSFDLVLARPNTSNFKEIEKIGLDVNTGKTVILNLELVKQEDATRILDFLWGVAFANEDEIKPMAKKTYAIIPKSVNFLGVDLVNELESSGYTF